MRVPFRSVRFRTTLAATALTAVVLVIGAIAIVTVVERDLMGAARESLEDAYAQAQTRVGDTDGGDRRVLRVRGGDESLLLTYSEPEDHSAGTSVTGFLLEAGESEPVARITFDAETFEILGMAGIGGEDLEDDLIGLDLASAADIAGGERAVASALTEAALHEVRESVDAVSAALLLIVPALVLVLGVATWILVGRALRPVHAISKQVASISASTLEERVPVPQTDDEIAEMATLMNQMLDRIEQGSERQRQFVADASHELRSPLSTIKAAAEVAEASEDPTRFGQLAGDVSAEADRMEVLIADLLDLARLDEDGVSRGETVDLAATCRAAVERLPDSRIPVEVTLVPAFVQGDHDQLERAVFNLVLNAQQHADTLVELRLSVGGDLVVMDVDDDGPGIVAADRERVFERFVRLDSSRSRQTGGAGIGLSLVSLIVERHRGTVTVSEAPGLGGARFHVELPVSAS